MRIDQFNSDRTGFVAGCLKGALAERPAASAVDDADLFFAVDTEALYISHLGS